MQQAQDYLDEVTTLAAVIAGLSDADFDQPTLFKGWTINDVIGHLHMFDHAALLTLQNPTTFATFITRIMGDVQAGKSLLETQYPWLDGLSGRALAGAWRATANEVATAYAKADPKLRLAWAGPDMSALSCITARQMETWAHGQEVFDVLGQTRVEGPRIRNICHLGVATYGWTFANRGMPVPEPVPHVRLISPTGETWDWNAPQDDNCVTGSAVDFARVVTQVRNIADTDLRLTGRTAASWMSIAQCFAGAPETPPARGSRHKAL